jgi:hypothetical protein
LARILFLKTSALIKTLPSVPVMMTTGIARKIRNRNVGAGCLADLQQVNSQQGEKKIPRFWMV